MTEKSMVTAPPDSIRYNSINKAKGLDARAVILIGLPSLAKPTKDLAYNWFMGASRARQLLAVVEGGYFLETQSIPPHLSHPR